jgi:hypothetical protein
MPVTLDNLPAVVDYFLPVTPVLFASMVGHIRWRGRAGWRKYAARALALVEIASLSYCTWLVFDFLSAYLLQGTMLFNTLQALAGPAVPAFVHKLTPHCYWGWQGEFLLYALSINAARAYWQVLTQPAYGDGLWLNNLSMGTMKVPTPGSSDTSSNAA